MNETAADRKQRVALLIFDNFWFIFLLSAIWWAPKSGLNLWPILAAAIPLWLSLIFLLPGRPRQERISSVWLFLALFGVVWLFDLTLLLGVVSLFFVLVLGSFVIWAAYVIRRTYSSPLTREILDRREIPETPSQPVIFK